MLDMMLKRARNGIAVVDKVSLRDQSIGGMPYRPYRIAWIPKARAKSAVSDLNSLLLAEDPTLKE